MEGNVPGHPLGFDGYGDFGPINMVRGEGGGDENEGAAAAAGGGGGDNNDDDDDDDNI